MNFTSRDTTMPRSFLVSRQQPDAPTAHEDIPPLRVLPDAHDPNEMTHNVIAEINQNIRKNFHSSAVRLADGRRETEYSSSPVRDGAPMPLHRPGVIANCIRNMFSGGPWRDEQVNSAVVWSWATAAKYWQNELSISETSGSNCRQLNDHANPRLLAPLIQTKHTPSDDRQFSKTGWPSTATHFAGGDVDESSANLLPTRTSGSVTRATPWRPFAVDEDDRRHSDDTERAAPVNQAGTPGVSDSVRGELKSAYDIQQLDRGFPNGVTEYRRAYITEEKLDSKPMQSGEVTTPQGRAHSIHRSDHLHAARLIRTPDSRTTVDEDLAGDGMRLVTECDPSNLDPHEPNDGRCQDRNDLNYTPQVIHPFWYDVISESYHLRRGQQTSCLYLPTSYVPWRSHSLSSSDASPSSLSSSPSPSHQAHQLVIAGMLLSPGFPENPAVANTTCSRFSLSTSASDVRSVVRTPPTHATTTMTEKTIILPLTCTYCDKVYTSAGALKMHIRTHTLPCRCPHCGKAFSRLWLLRGHLRTHTGERPFRCPDQDCRRAFADRSNLRAHLRTHSTDLGGSVGADSRMTVSRPRRYGCAVCGKTFSRMSLLARHEMNAACQRATSLN